MCDNRQEEVEKAQEEAQKPLSCFDDDSATTFCPLDSSCQTLNMSLTYDDKQFTPARCVPYKLVFEDGTELHGVLDANGEAQVPDCPNCTYTIEYYPDDTEDAIEKELQEARSCLKESITETAQCLREVFKKSIDNIPPPNPQDAELMERRAQLRHVVEAEINALRARAQEYEALPWYSQSWENLKATASGIGKGVTEYLPDFGELGDIWEVMDIDIVVIVDAIATGNIDKMEDDFRKWKSKGLEGYEEASETMEVLILLLSDRQTREYLASLPQRFLEVTPTAELVELAVAQGTQVGIDTGATLGTTVMVGAVTGPGGAVAGSTVFLATSARKAGKAMEALTNVLNKMVRLLKKKRNKRKTKKNHQKTELARDNNNSKKKDDDDKVYPVIDLDSDKPLNISYFDKDHKYCKPARITLKLGGKGKTEYKGDGKVKITSGSGKLYSDKNCTKGADTKYNSRELKKGQQIYVMATDNKGITIELTLLDSQKNLKVVKRPTKEIIPVKEVNTIWPVIRREVSDIRSKNGDIQEYVALVDASNDYDFNEAKARIYVDIILEESIKDYPYNPETITLHGDRLLFFETPTGKKRLSAKIPYSDFKSFTDERYRIENRGATVAKYCRVYLEAKDAKKSETTLSMNLPESENYLRGRNESDLKIGTEDVDKELGGEIERKKIGKRLVAKSKAVIHKCGEKTQSSTKVNFPKDEMDEALALFLENELDKGLGFKKYAKFGDKYEEVKQEGKLYRSTVNSANTSTQHLYKIRKDVNIESVFTKYIGKLEQLGLKTHRLIKKSIKERLKDYLLPDYLPNDPHENPTFANKAPGLHAEVLAVNEVLNTYFAASEDREDCLRITVMTYNRGNENFKACHNCTAILNNDNHCKVRIPTGLS